MNDIDKLKMERRRLEVEIKRLKEKLDGLVGQKDELDRRINMHQQPGDNKNFNTGGGGMFA